MKQIYSIFISAALLLNVGLTSCDSFLAETPRGELTESQCFYFHKRCGSTDYQLL